VLSIPGQYWWNLESETLDGIAFGILFNHTADRELAELRSKAFALEVLGPLVAPTQIVESAIDAWLMAAPNRPAPVRRPGPDSRAIPCTSCGARVPVAGRHFALVSVFGTTCDRCRGVAA
jgi:hypothetical protein